MSHISLTPAKYARQLNIPPAPAYRERITFPDGDHVALTVEDPDYVEVRGVLVGDAFHMSLRSDAADENAALLIDGNTADELWDLPTDRARRIGHALHGAATAARDAIPEADSPEDVDAPQENSTRVALDGGHADVDVFTDRIEVTIRLAGRSVLGIALSHMEAANLGRAIASPDGATTGDLFHLADTLNIDAGDILRLSGGAR